MSFCINPWCPNAKAPTNANNRFCRECGCDRNLKQRYRVKRLLSNRSGFGNIYEADCQGTPKILKVLKLNTPIGIELFQREAEILRNVDRPGIPKLDEYFIIQPPKAQQPIHCIVMEKVNGQNLEQWMQGKPPINQKQALNWLKQLTYILAQVHERKYFHRDIKPSNIMRRPNGQLVLIDFGAAREITSPNLAKVNKEDGIAAIDSPGYTPPEQRNGKAVPQSDFYALGRTFVFLLTGKHPKNFQEDSQTGSLIWRGGSLKMSPLADLIDEIMAPLPERRPKNIAEILRRIEAIERHFYRPKYRLLRQSVGRKKIADGRTVLRGKKSRRVKQGAFANKGRSRSAQLGRTVQRRPRLLVAGLLFLSILGVIKIASWLTNPCLLNRTMFCQPISAAKTLNFHSEGINSIAISPDGKTIASGGEDGTIKVWNLGNNKDSKILIGHEDAVKSVTISPDGQILASGSKDNTIKVWDMTNGILLNSFQSHPSWVNSIAISSDGKILVTASGNLPKNSENSIKVWDLATGRSIQTFKGHTLPIRAVAISSDGQTIASGSDDGTIKIWNLATGQAKITLKGHAGSILSVAISPDGQTIASGSADKTIKVWHLFGGASDTMTPIPRPLTGHQQSVRAIAFSSDGHTLVSSSDDDTIKVWNLPTGADKYTYSDRVSSVSNNSEGKSLEYKQ